MSHLISLKTGIEVTKPLVLERDRSDNITGGGPFFIFVGEIWVPLTPQIYQTFLYVSCIVLFELFEIFGICIWQNLSHPSEDW